MSEYRTETDSLGDVSIPADRLWGAGTQRAIGYFDAGDDLVPNELILAYAFVKKAAAVVNFRHGLLDEYRKDLIARASDEILSGRHRDMFPLKVWMSGSGTPVNMNVNEVIANRCSQLSGHSPGSRNPVHPNDHVNLSQSTNDTFPSAIHIASALAIRQRLIPAVRDLENSLGSKAGEWQDIIKIGRTHLQDAVPLTLGQEFSGYAGLLHDGIDRLEDGLKGVYRLALGGTAVGTGLNAPEGFDRDVAAEIAGMTGLPFTAADNKFALMGSHDDLVMLSGSLRTLAVSLYKIANDIRLLGSGPRCGIHELELPANEPGSSIMPGKVNPTQCEALAMIAVQAMADDVAVTFGGGGGILEMNVYKPLIAYNLLHSVRILTDGCRAFDRFLVAGIRPDRRQIDAYLGRSLMLVTALSPVIGYDQAAETARFARKNDLTLREAVLQLGHLDGKEFDRLVDPAKMLHPFVPT